jgi:tetratricopeptide (TPR) repeat protein
VASHPRNAAAWLNLGVALRLKGDVDGAINAYHAALNINPQYALAYNNLALVLKEKKNFDGAVRAFEEALRINPKYALAHTNLGLLYHARGDLDGAIGAYQAAIKSDPQYVDAHYCLGIALRDKRDVRGAIASYREAIKVDAKYADAHNNLAYILASGPDEVRDGRLAVEHATRACELTDWKNPRPIATLSFAYAEIGDFDKANKYLEHALTFPAFLKETGPGAQVTLGKYARKQPYRDPTLALSKPHEPAPPPREVKRP